MCHILYILQLEKTNNCNPVKGYKKKINEEEDNVKVTGSIGVEYKLSENKKGA